MQPIFFYLVGMISVLATKRGRRLGDLVAGTIVVREEARSAPVAAPSAAPSGEHAAALHTQLSEDEYVAEEQVVFQALREIRARKEELARQYAAERDEDEGGIGIYTGYGDR